MEETDFMREVLKRGLITAEQGQECMKAQAVMLQSQVEAKLWEVLVLKRLASQAQVNAILRGQESTPRAVAFGPYILESKIGEGGMGAVYLARKQGDDQKVALKILPDRFSSDPAITKRFEREGAISIRLNHPNLVKAYERGKINGRWFFAMEYVPGKVLSEVIRDRGRIPEKEALKIALHTACALDAIDRANLIHRDIKPENIALVDDGTVKLMDLGLAKSTAKEITALTMSGYALGTPHYLSPEQIRGGEQDIRSDIYGLGATLYHMVTGVQPFQGATVYDILNKQLQDDLENPRSLCAELSDGICDVIEKMMALDPDDRHDSPDQLLQDLDGVLEGKALRSQRLEVGRSMVRKVGAAPGKKSLSTPPIRAGRAPKKLRRSVVAPRSGMAAWLLGGIGVACAIGIAGLVLSGGSGGGRPDPRTPAAVAQAFVPPKAGPPAVGAPPTRVESARLALEGARAFAKDNPGDNPGILKAYDKVIWDFDGIPEQEVARRERNDWVASRNRTLDAEFAEVSREAGTGDSSLVVMERARSRHPDPHWGMLLDKRLDELKARAASSLENEFAALQAKAKALLGGEDFKKALDEYERALSMHPEADWRTRIESAQAGIQEVLHSAYAAVRSGALEARSKGDEAGLRALTARVDRWGVPAYAADLKALLAEKTAPAAPPQASAAPPIPAAPVAPPKAARAPVPDDARLRDALRSFMSIYKLDFDEAKQWGSRALLLKLLDESRKAGYELPMRFVLLREARDLALTAGDVGSAMAAFDDMSEQFQMGDPAGQKLALLERASKGQVGADVAMGLAEGYFSLVDESLAADNFAQAKTFVSKVEKLAKDAQSLGLLTHAQSRAKDVTEVEREYRTARAMLQKAAANPGDQAACLTAGRYLSVFKREWDRGLPLLAKGSDATLRECAQRELANPKEPSAQVATGDGWWELGQKERDSRLRKRNLLARGAWWYEQALPQLPAAAKAALISRLDESERQTPWSKVNLLAILPPTIQPVKGKWTMAGGRLVCSGSFSREVLAIPYVPPQEYDLHLVVERLKGSESLYVGLAMGRTQFGVRMDEGTPPETGIECIDGQDGTSNGTTVTGQQLYTNRPRSILISVRSGSVDVAVDGRRIIHWVADYKRLTPESSWVVPNPEVLVLGSDDTSFSISACTILPMAGLGRRLR